MIQRSTTSSRRGVAGVNKRIAQVHDGAVPVPYGFGPDELNYLPEPYTLAHHGAVTKMLFLGQTNSITQELLATIVQRNLPDAWAAIDLTKPAFNVPTMPASELAGLAKGSDPDLDRIAPPPIDAPEEDIARAFGKLAKTMKSDPRRRQQQLGRRRTAHRQRLPADRRRPAPAAREPVADVHPAPQQRGRGG